MVTKNSIAAKLLGTIKPEEFVHPLDRSPTDSKDVFDKEKWQDMERVFEYVKKNMPQHKLSESSKGGSNG